MEVILSEGTVEDVPVCVRMACNSVIGVRYQFQADLLTQNLSVRLTQGALLIVARQAESILGFAWVEPKGAFGIAPYLKLIVVEEQARGLGIGSLLLKAFEQKTADQGRGWLLLVSDFNERAITFYKKHGYACVGRLPDFACSGIDELIMYKKRMNLPGKS